MAAKVSQESCVSTSTGRPGNVGGETGLKKGDVYRGAAAVTVASAPRELQELGKAMSPADFQFALEHGLFDAARPLTVADVQAIHGHKVRVQDDGVHRPSRDRFAPQPEPGRIRTRDMQIGAGLRAVDGALVSESFDAWARWLEQAERSCSPQTADLTAATAFRRFMVLHPFDTDGNGRTGRMLLNVLLVRHGLPAIDLSQIEWTRGPFSADPEDASYLARLIAQVRAGQDVKGLRRYGEGPAKSISFADIEANPNLPANDMLECVYQYIGWQPGSVDMLWDAWQRARPTAGQHREMVRLFRVGAELALHPATQAAFEYGLQLFSSHPVPVEDSFEAGAPPCRPKVSLS